MTKTTKKALSLVTSSATLFSLTMVVTAMLSVMVK